MSKVPTRSPSHREIEFDKLAGLGLDLEDVAVDDAVTLAAVIELAEDRGRPPSHYLAGLALASELTLTLPPAPIAITACAGKCQSWGALDVIDRAVEAIAAKPGRYSLAVRSCLDLCDRAAAVRIDSPSGSVVLTEASARKLDEALAAVE
jgi:NADH:ubiquinone oxidoreductase subunit E